MRRALTALVGLILAIPGQASDFVGSIKFSSSNIYEIRSDVRIRVAYVEPVARQKAAKDFRVQFREAADHHEEETYSFVCDLHDGKTVRFVGKVMRNGVEYLHAKVLEKDKTQYFGTSLGTCGAGSDIYFQKEQLNAIWVDNRIHFVSR
jgi:hypothetical protein